MADVISGDFTGKSILEMPPRVAPATSGVPHVINFDSSGAIDPDESADPPLNYLQSMFRSIDDMLAIMSMDGYLTKINPAFETILKWDSRKLRSKPIESFIHPDDVYLFKSAAHLLKIGQTKSSFACRLICGNGSYKYIQWNMSLDSRGFIYLSGKDVTSIRAGIDSDISKVISEEIRSAVALIPGMSAGASKTAVRMSSNVDTLVKYSKWLIGAVSVIFAAGVYYSQFISDNATKSDISTHVESKLGPVKRDVEAVKSDIGSIRTDVSSLVDSEADRSKSEKARSDYEHKLRLYQAYKNEYEARLSEYIADRAAGKRTVRPQKDPEHVNLEVEVLPHLGAK